jgi:CelD/BcsL family acetyltransferase involved in cellulose biosynthesis
MATSLRTDPRDGGAAALSWPAGIHGRLETMRLIETAAELEALGPAWTGLASPEGSPMQSHAWAGAFAEAYGAEYELKVLVADAGGEVLAIAPLAARRIGFGRLEFVGGSELSEPMDFVYRDVAALERLAAGMADLGRPMLLRRMEARSPSVAALHQAYRRRTIFYSREVAPVPWIPLHDGWRDPESQLSSDRRSALARAGRRAVSDGAVTAEVIAPERDELPSLLAELYRVEAAGWKGRSGTALTHDDRLRAFFSSFAARAADVGMLRLAFLRIGDHTAAVQLAAECGGAFWLLKVGYDERFRRGSPGMLLMLETIRYAANRGLTSFELLGTVEPWTRMWTSSARKCVAVRAYPASPGGLATAALDAGRFAGNRARQR